MPDDRPVPLSGTTRADHLERLRSATADSPLDVLVVGGGVNGAGAAFDAASRGLNVGLVEASDWASGTSSRSSKLMHGGLRYLQMLDFTLVAEALRERDRLLTRTAPHLVRRISFVFPFFRHAVDRAFIGSGVALYDAMQTVGRKRAVPFHRHLSRRRMLERFRGLDGDKAVGAIEYFDAQMDDARFVMMLVRSAVEHGAAATTYTRVLDYLRDGEDVIGATVRDETTGEELDVHARTTILAGGVWTGRQQDLVTSEQGLRVQASKGVHLVVPRERIPAVQDVGIITQTEKSVLFIIPSDEYWVIGTTDTPWEADVDDVATTATDIDYILEHANAVLESDLTHDDIIGTFAGLRPLVQPVRSSEKGSAKVSREHTVMQVAPGLSAIAGGKYTTYRVMAEDVVDFAIKDVFPGRRSVTESVPVLGGQGFAEAQRDSGAIANRLGLDAARMERLLFRYGTLVRDVLAPADADHELAQPLSHAPRYLRAEVLYAAREEGVVHLADVMKRRLRLDYEVRDRGHAAAQEIADLIAPELGWDQDRIAAEVSAYRAHVAARLAAEKVATDKEAARLIADAPEVPTLT
ncbi:MAG TPA: glycerol-3-phosphate dehydrogenase/oxidase [Candidatus Brachybacterium merdavium]|uniref:Glycerol-3-phosphate dehydrogenase n=1 Tax=Candidatus Brachybacterium merdavium TaxID=2838513 RepID=A0A9D2RNL4_9MICO|nr:glycerol-3-phosphate dehydrogenase/oxidase [Candidatus Brachybacterium merdavium]